MKEKFLDFAVKKNVQNHFLALEFCQVTDMQNMKNFDAH